MNDQYYTREPESASRPVECAFAWRGKSLRFTTDAGVFSRGELDAGTRLLMDALPEAPEEEKETEKKPESDWFSETDGLLMRLRSRR